MTLLDRRTLLTSTVAGVALLATGCGTGSGGSGEAAGGASTGATGAGAAGAFPVTIKHALGTATIPAAPKRVVTLGQGAAETAIALGVIPVGTETYAWGADKDGHLPWVKEAVQAAGGTLPTTFTGGQQVDVEKIAELSPDLILAPWSGITAAEYDQLKDIAPTVAYAKTPWATTWDGEITTVATALGKPDQAPVLIKKIDDTLAAAAKAHPRWAGKTFAYTYTTGPGTLGVYMPQEQRVTMISKLGLTLDPVIATLQPKDGADYTLIGLENANKLKDADLLFTFYMDAATKKQVESQPLYAAIPAVKRGTVVTSSDQQLVTAMSMINPLTVPWALPRLSTLIDEKVALLG
ncbi:iron-siderophore ABC transporter substrate-binding protein [Arsenicicoccus piscis]|uniref:Periplasmic binding protein n=1 Tax=Arsenicicoccus piscis TaxID=673954 RepID=A0ABQ6HLH5_9MICO|nr:iron-siderophore ABC transporter substrate-binding protein [Arsenicicoccus piscis]MCH8628724.1 iron-siderophore ABC transporter substrate-binding protein [Arsenicicoccus piscis]GMA19333.1 periplasmic binding protein [Arsenicicoccus piscis]